MATLGLLPPYSEADVRRAYRMKARAAHPDAGGTPGALQAVTKAHERALEYVAFQARRRWWLADHVDVYIRIQRALRCVETLGGEAETETDDWRRDSLGDFADLCERIIAVRLPGLRDGDAALGELLEHADVLQGTRLLDLGALQLTDAGLLRLGALRGLVRLDLRSTPVTGRGLAVFAELPRLESINLYGTRVTRWSRMKLRWSARRLQIVDSPTCPFTASPPTRFDNVAELVWAR